MFLTANDKYADQIVDGQAGLSFWCSHAKKLWFSQHGPNGVNMEDLWRTIVQVETQNPRTMTSRQVRNFLQVEQVSHG